LIVRREPLHPGAQGSLFPSLPFRHWGHHSDNADGDAVALDVHVHMRAHAHVETTSQLEGRRSRPAPPRQNRPYTGNPPSGQATPEQVGPPSRRAFPHGGHVLQPRPRSRPRRQAWPSDIGPY
jgi:hypothetical protein